MVSGQQRKKATKALDDDRKHFGIVSRQAEAVPEHFDVDPENAETLDLFLSLSGSWNIGLRGATGLRLEAIEPLLRLKGIRRSRWPELTAALLAMEAEALDEMAVLQGSAGIAQ